MENEVFALYERLELSVFSFDLYYDETKKKKAPVYIGSWKTADLVKTPQQSGYGLRTGEEFGVTAIDIDDVSLEHNKKLYDIMIDTCNMVAKTNKGFHFIYEYRRGMKNSQDSEYKLDVRNDGGHLYVEPSTYKIGNKKIEYKWIKTPLGSRLNAIPSAVIQILAELDAAHFFAAEMLNNDDEEDEPQPQTKEPPDEEMFLDILNNLKPKRINDYGSWLSIGIILKNEGLPFDVYDKASMKSKYYNKKECMEKWRSFHSSRGKPLTQATLWKWLKEDSPDTFYSYLTKRKDLEKLFELLNNKDAAKYFYNMKPDDYLYNEAMGWFVLQKNKTWKVAEKQTPSIIKLHISNTLHEILEPYVEQKQKDFIKQKREAKNDDEKATIKKREIDFLTFTSKLYKVMGSSEFINGVISFLPSFYNDDDLANKIDNSRYLFAFNDCIFNLETMEKRNIQPSDYITITTNYDYPTSVPETKKQVETFLFGLFENKETLEYFLLTLAFGILGYNRFEEFYIWLGSGSNAKGVMDQMLKKAFGGYYYSVDSTLFTQRNDSKDKPMPALVEARNKRIMVSTEPESDETLQVGFLKKFTGGDSIEARTLYSKNIVCYVPQCTPIIQVNCPPKLSKIDQGIERRLRIIGFPFKFLPAHKMTNPTIHRLGDPDVKDKLSKSDEWRNEFILILLDIYGKNRTLKALKMAPLVEEATRDYMGDNNKVGNWLSQHYTLTNNNDDEIQAKELRNAYLMDTNTDKVSEKWFKEMMNFNNIQSKKKHNAVFYTGLQRKIIIE